MRLSIALFSVLFAFRVATVVSIQPLDAPDEVGHLILANSLARGHWMTLREELEYVPRYPYALFSQVPYFPSAGALALGALFDPSLTRMDKPEPRFSSAAVYVARAGMLVWFVLFAVFLLLLTRDLAPWPRTLFVLIPGLLPQLTFTQCYVNLDAMGLAVMMVLLWAVRESRGAWVTAGVYGVLLAKLNFLCLLPLPIVWVARRPRHLLPRAILVTLIIPALLVGGWLWDLNSQGQFEALYGLAPGRWRIFERWFLGNTLNSGFGLFGYFTYPLPSPFFWVWKGVVLPAGVAALALTLWKKAPPLVWHRTLAAVFAANFVLHYGLSFVAPPSPQGRYLFPAFLIALGYLLKVLGEWPTPRRKPLEIGLLAFFLASAVAGVYYA